VHCQCKRNSHVNLADTFCTCSQSVSGSTVKHNLVSVLHSHKIWVELYKYSELKLAKLLISYVDVVISTVRTIPRKRRKRFILLGQNLLSHLIAQQRQQLWTNILWVCPSLVCVSTVWVTSQAHLALQLTAWCCHLMDLIAGPQYHCQSVLRVW